MLRGFLHEQNIEKNLHVSSLLLYLTDRNSFDMSNVSMHLRLFDVPCTHVLMCSLWCQHDACSIGLFIFSSPAGMIEGTPQLHANAWKVSSACSVPINIPVVDPCNINQQNGMISQGNLELFVSYCYGTLLFSLWVSFTVTIH